MTSKEKLLLIGFGDIASRISQLAAKDYQTSGFKRSAIQHPSANIILGDCHKPSDLQKLFNQESGFDVIVITLTPEVINEAGYQRAYLESSDQLLEVIKGQTHQPRLIIFVSSTSVYGQQNGEWVDENSKTEPTSFSGKILLATEQRWQRSEFNTCIVRPSGIYGPGRKRLIKQVRSGQGTASQPVLYSNRIHADDVAAAIYHLIQIAKTGSIKPCYLLSDSEPTPLHQVKLWLAQAMGIAKENLHTQPTGRSFRGSKRCLNERLKRSGFTLQYDTFREGYQALLDDMST